MVQIRSLSTIAVLCLFLSYRSTAEDSWIQGRFAPGLSRLMADNAAALKVLTNTFSEVFSSRSVGLFYFYSTNEAEAKAYHFYSDAVGVPEVMICVRENQEPLDQFICILFEMLNSRREPVFTRLVEEAQAGKISRETFARGILEAEFEANKATQEQLLSLKINKRSIIRSHYYKLYSECPTNFDDFLQYCARVSSKRDVFKEYEAKYDALRKMSEASNAGDSEPGQHDAGIDKNYEQIRSMGLVDRAQHDFSSKHPMATMDKWTIGYFMHTNMVWCDVQYHEPNGAQMMEQEFGYIFKHGTNWTLVWQVRGTEGEDARTNR